MNDTIWQDFLAGRGAHFESGQVVDFGRPDEEIAAAQEGTVLVPLSHLAVIECAGEDAQAFLHSQTTNDVSRLPADGAQYSAWCSAKGRMQANFLLYRQGTAYRALLSADLQEATRMGLQKYILRSKVRLGELSGNVALGLAGARADVVDMALRAAGLALPEKPMTTAAFETAAGAAMLIRPGGTIPRCIIVADAAVAARFFDLLAGIARPAGAPVWQWFDIQAGFALIVAATRDEFVPQMIGFDKIGGISFNKGCYPGQEIVARAHYLGQVKRHLYRLRIAASAVPVVVGDAVYSADGSGQPCGIVASAAPAPGGGYAALAVIKESAVQPHTGALRIASVDVSAIEAVFC